MASRGYTKQLQALLADWGFDLRGNTPELVPAIFPTICIDDADEYLYRTWPIFGATVTQAGVAAVYSFVGITAQTRPIRVLGARCVVPTAVQVNFGFATTDLRTANQAVAGIAGLARGGDGTTVGALSGTRAAIAGLLPWVAYAPADTLFSQPPIQRQDDIILRPGEYLWFLSTTVNTNLWVAFMWEELLLPVQPNPQDRG